MGLFDRYDELKNIAIKTQSRITILDQELKLSKDNLKQRQDTLVHAQKTQFTLQTCQTVMKQLIDTLSTKHINQVQSLLTIALKTIFFDRNYTVEFVLDDKRNARSLELFLIEQFPDGSTIRSPFDDGIGGGILSVAGFVLQVYYLLLYKLRPIIFCDESFTQLSDQYIDPLMQFIKQLADQNNLSVVLVSHDPRFIEKADSVYEVANHTITYKKVSHD